MSVEYKNPRDCRFKSVKNVMCFVQDNCGACAWNPENETLREIRVEKIRRELKEKENKMEGEEDGNDTQG